VPGQNGTSWAERQWRDAVTSMHGSKVAPIRLIAPTFLLDFRPTNSARRAAHDAQRPTGISPSILLEDIRSDDVEAFEAARGEGVNLEIEFSLSE
jgi:hypothetical protein